MQEEDELVLVQEVVERFVGERGFKEFLDAVKDPDVEVCGVLSRLEL